MDNYSSIYIKSNIPKEMIDNDIKITGITISFDKYERYYLSINYKYLTEINQITSETILDAIENNLATGYDIGLKNKVISNRGEKFLNIKDTVKFKNLEKKQKELQRKLSKKIEYNKEILLKQRKNKTITKKTRKKIEKTRKKNKYSNKIKVDKLDKKKFKEIKTDNQFSKKETKEIYNDLKVKKLQKEIQKIESKITNIKVNENHQLSNFIVDNNDFIFMEDLTFKGMQKLWGKSIKDLQLSSLIQQIKYKAENQGKVFIQIGKFFPSSKNCSYLNN